MLEKVIYKGMWFVSGFIRLNEPIYCYISFFFAASCNMQNNAVTLIFIEQQYSMKGPYMRGSLQSLEFQ